jgi:hypothetical protein
MENQDSPQVAKYPSFGHTGILGILLRFNQKRQKRMNNEAFCAGKGSEMVTESASSGSSQSLSGIAKLLDLNRSIV